MPTMLGCARKELKKDVLSKANVLNGCAVAAQANDVEQVLAMSIP